MEDLTIEDLIMENKIFRTKYITSKKMYKTFYDSMDEDNYTVVLKDAFKFAIDEVGQISDGKSDELVNFFVNKSLFLHLSVIMRILPLLSEAKAPKKSIFLTVCTALLGLTKEVYDNRRIYNIEDLAWYVLNLKGGCSRLAAHLHKILASA